MALSDHERDGLEHNLAQAQKWLDEGQLTPDQQTLMYNHAAEVIEQLEELE